jgi:hypothetical protein
LSNLVFGTDSGLLVILKCDLLRQHNVSDGKIPLGAEAPRGRARACFIELVNIHLVGTADAITFAAMAAPYFEMPIISYWASCAGYSTASGASQNQSKPLHQDAEK